MTQGELAEAVGVSRQALSAIEAGRSVPAVTTALQIAAVLSTTVEALFGHDDDGAAVFVDGVGLRSGDAVVCGRVDGRWVAHAASIDEPPRSIDGVVEGRGRVTLVRSPREVEDTLFVAGCAPALAALAERTARRVGTPCHHVSCASQTALHCVREGRVHVGGIHLSSNEAAFRRLEDGDALLVTLSSWEAGLCFRSGTAPVKDIAGLARRGLRLAWRESGSSAHTLALRLLREASVDADAIADIDDRAVPLTSHLAVGRAVAAGFSDVGFTIRAAARACGLDFLPLARERFDLVVPGALRDDRRIKALLDVVADGAFRRELFASGYDADDAGQRPLAA